MVAGELAETGRSVRAQCRDGSFSSQTSGLAPGYVQANIVMLPSDGASDFQTFCQRNPRPCPLLAMSPSPGDPALPAAGTDSAVCRALLGVGPADSVEAVPLPPTAAPRVDRR